MLDLYQRAVQEQIAITFNHYVTHATIGSQAARATIINS
jgi:hypothetical protein